VTGPAPGLSGSGLGNSQIHEHLATAGLSWGEGVYQSQLICAEQLYATTGIRIGRGAIVLWSPEGPRPALDAALEQTRDLQAAHLAEHGVYASDLEALGPLRAEASVELALEITGDGSGWKATAAREGFTFVGAMTGGDAPLLLERMRPLTVVCPAGVRSG
jgi:hypothetical protein